MTSASAILPRFSPGHRDRAIIVVALTVLTALAWSYLVYDARRMTAGICEMCMPLAHAWSVREFLMVFLMWSVMMVGMMTPSVAPAVMLFAGLNRQRRAADGPFVPTAAFLAGYLLVWTLFSLVITFVQAGLHRAALLSPAMVSRSPSLGGGILIAAGIFQWLAIKSACLRHCQSPLALFMTHWREGARGAVRMGFGHGIECLTCCWLLMVLLFVVGVMNLLWIAAITVFVLVEKVFASPWVSRVAGAILVASGIWMVLRS